MTFIYGLLATSLVATMIATPAASQPFPRELLKPEITIEVHGLLKSPYATITFTNSIYGYPGAHEITLSTPEGDIVLEHFVTPNTFGSVACCEDRLRVLHKPDSLIAKPGEIGLEEQANGEIHLYLFNGM